MLRRHARRFTSFGVIGASVFLFGQLQLWLLVELGRSPPLAANALQLSTTIILNFVLNVRFTWVDRERTNGAMLRFVTSRLLSAGVVYLLFLGLVTVVGVQYLLANVIGTLVGMFGNYVCGEMWIFPGKDASGKTLALGQELAEAS
ncbi:hypothetical protein BH09PAT4_BH09PAT4_00400 [soil metagenome]